MWLSNALYIVLHCVASVRWMLHKKNPWLILSCGISFNGARYNVNVHEINTDCIIFPVDEDELKAAFEFFDVHKRGVLTPADLKQRYLFIHKYIHTQMFTCTHTYMHHMHNIYEFWHLRTWNKGIPYMHAQTRTCTYTHTCAKIYACMSRRHTYTTTHTHMHIDTNIQNMYPHLDTCVHVNTRMHMYINIHIHMHTCIHKHTDTHVHTHAHNSQPMNLRTHARIHTNTRIHTHNSQAMHTQAHAFIPTYLHIHLPHILC